MISDRDLGPDGIISTMTHSSGRTVVTGATFQSATNWPTANKAYYVRIMVPFPSLITAIFWVNGSAASGNVDTGIYDSRTLTKLASTGSTARVGTSATQKVTLTNPVLLLPGEYLMAHVSDTTTNSRTAQYIRSLLGDIELEAGSGQETSAFPLPATATPVTETSTFLIPVVGLITSRCGL